MHMLVSGKHHTVWTHIGLPSDGGVEGTDNNIHQSLHKAINARGERGWAMHDDTTAGACCANAAVISWVVSQSWPHTSSIASYCDALARATI